jgi:predicted nucleic acid-binding protein
MNSLENENFSDFEDCLQMEYAKEFGAKYIVTRNTEDYKMSDIPAITPKEYLKVLREMD